MSVCARTHTQKERESNAHTFIPSNISLCFIDSTNHTIFIKIFQGTGEMVNLLRALAVLTEDLVLLPAPTSDGS